MKKYVKPELFYENFELAQHVAACGWELQYASKAACIAIGNESTTGYPSEVKAFTVGQVSGCEIEPENYCYNNGSSGDGTFLS